MDTVTEEEGGMNKESNIETYTLPCVKQIADGRLLYDSRAQTRLLCDNLEGWDGVAGGREIQEGGDICMPMTDSCWIMQKPMQYCKTILLQLKINKLYFFRKEKLQVDIIHKAKLQMKTSKCLADKY